MNTKTAILGEMAFLYCTTLLVYHKNHGEVTLPTLLTTAGLRSGAACALLTGVLLIADDMGAGALAVLLGLLIVGSSLIMTAVPASEAFTKLLNSLLADSRS